MNFCKPIKGSGKKVSCCGTMIPVVDKQGKIIGAICNMCKKEYPASYLSSEKYSTR